VAAAYITLADHARPSVALWQKCDSVADGRGASTETAAARTVTDRRERSRDPLRLLQGRSSALFWPGPSSQAL